MIQQILEMWHAGFNPNQIAARFTIQKSYVESVISGSPIPTPVGEDKKPTPKKKAAVARKKIK